MLGSLIGIVVVRRGIDRRGLGWPFAAGFGLFAIGLVIGGLAPSMGVLVAARFIQGLGAGAIPPIAYVAIGRRLPDRLRPQMFATLSTAWVIPGVIGPAIAGIVGETLGWRFVFLGLLPLIAVAGPHRLPRRRRVGRARRGGLGRGADGRPPPTRRRLPLALVVAAGTGLLLAGLHRRRPASSLVVLGVGACHRPAGPPGTDPARHARGPRAACPRRCSCAAS